MISNDLNIAAEDFFRAPLDDGLYAALADKVRRFTGCTIEKACITIDTFVLQAVQIGHSGDCGLTDEGRATLAKAMGGYQRGSTPVLIVEGVSSPFMVLPLPIVIAAHAVMREMAGRVWAVPPGGVGLTLPRTLVIGGRWYLAHMMTHLPTVDEFQHLIDVNIRMLGEDNGKV